MTSSNNETFFPHNILLDVQFHSCPMSNFNNLLMKAKEGDPTSQFQLAWLFYDGDGVEQSYTKAIEWFKKAAGQGNVDAQFNIGRMYEGGTG